MRWNPAGDMLASASDDEIVKLLDFKTGKTIHTGNTSDGCKKRLYYPILNLNLISRLCHVCLLPIENDKMEKSLEERVT